VEMGLKLAGVPHKAGGINAALDRLALSHQQAAGYAPAPASAVR